MRARETRSRLALLGRVRLGCGRVAIDQNRLAKPCVKDAVEDNSRQLISVTAASTEVDRSRPEVGWV